MNLIFLYNQTRHGRFYAERVREEGYFALIRRMVETGIAQEALIVIETTRDQEGEIRYGPNLRGLLLSDISLLTDTLHGHGHDCVLWCRGGFKGWHDFLQKASLDHWVILYGANTNRWKWPFWHAILDDLEGADFVDRSGRLHVDFRKPANEDLFHPMNLNLDWDLCIGASRIHDRKGQWRAIDALIAYQKRYGRNLRAVMPGPWSHGTETNQIERKIAEHGLEVEAPGELKRSDLAEVMNRSRLFVHLGSHGQGDRGVIEALACGCPVMLGYLRYHAPYVWRSGQVCSVASHAGDPEVTAKEISTALVLGSETFRRRIVYEYFLEQAGLEQASLLMMKKLFEAFRKVGKPDREALQKEYGAWTSYL